MALWGEPGPSHNYKHNYTLYVLSVQATAQLHEQVNGILRNL